MKFACISVPTIDIQSVEKGTANLRKLKIW